MTKEQENFISDMIQIGDKLMLMKNRGYTYNVTTYEQSVQIQDIAKQILELSDEIYQGCRKE